MFDQRGDERDLLVVPEAAWELTNVKCAGAMKDITLVEVSASEANSRM
ncbi:MAG TPA: hypothetical protein VEW64_09180 [Methyloceanibacter sp.]|nr:hypothetical protein [Methyloceanibacter sp.]